MKKILLSFLLFTICIKAQEMPPIDVFRGMSSNGESESVKMANEALKNNKTNNMTEKFERSTERVDNLKPSSFKEVLQNTPPLEVSKATKNIESVNEVGKEPVGEQQLFKVDNSESWNEDIDLHKYYDEQADGSFIKKGIKQKENSDNNLFYSAAILFAAVALFFE